MVHKYDAAIYGARGYTGLELARLLLDHPKIQLKQCFATQDFALDQEFDHPKASAVTCHSDQDELQDQVSLVFLATPAEVSLQLAPKLLKQNRTVIDLSGAFRLKSHDYKTWYQHDHSQPGLLKPSHYGLMPWAGPSQGTRLIANPGCYATAVAMGLVPLLKEKLIDPDQIIIDAKSGATGAGRKASENLLFTEVEGDCLPYKVGKHQHTPEIIEAVQMHSGATIDPHFTTHLLPVRRGIIAGLYLKSLGATKTEILQSLKKAYEHYPLVKVHDLSVSSKAASLKRVSGTPMTHLLVEQVGQKLFVFSVIDNLLKGAASQAVENSNLLLDLPLTTGLEFSRGVL